MVESHEWVFIAHDIELLDPGGRPGCEAIVLLVEIAVFECGRVV
jgi:hypothetical protein